jgi:L-fuconolactonase
MVVDAHQHFWNYRPENHGWITPDMSAIRKNFLPADLAPIYREHKVDGCVAVQVDQTEEENKFLIELAGRNPFIKGVVGWVDLRAASIEERLAFYSSISVVKGFRHIVQAEADKKFLLSDFFCRGISMLKTYNFSYDILVYSNQLDQVEPFVQRFPDQSFIIDHLAKPQIMQHEIGEWEKRMRSIAKHENVYCKLSGMVTEADWKKWTYNDLEPYMQVVLEAFGARRLVYGSDWPVCLLAAGYQQQFEVVKKFIGSLSSSEQQMILGENAVRFYHL